MDSDGRPSLLSLWCEEEGRHHRCPVLVEKWSVVVSLHFAAVSCLSPLPLSGAAAGTFFGPAAPWVVHEIALDRERTATLS